MKYIENNAGCFHSSEDVVDSLSRLCAFIMEHPHILKPVRGVNNEIKEICSERGFHLYSTVKKTTLLYDRESNCFFKILHPLTLKARALFLFTNRAERIYRLSERLISEGLRVADVIAYGTLKTGRKPLYAMRRVEGRSLYDILIKEKMPLKPELYKRVMDEVARLHKLGYWLGDAHLSHIFVDDSGVSGFIDVDSIRRNHHFNIRNMAKDIAGLNYPRIPITDNEKTSLLDYYMDRASLEDKERFLRLLTFYTKRRWEKTTDRRD